MKFSSISLLVLLQIAPSQCRETSSHKIRTRSLSKTNSTTAGEKNDAPTLAVGMEVNKNKPAIRSSQYDVDQIKQTRIVGGDTITDPTEYPYIGFPIGSSNCVATLFHDNLMVTSANCKDAFASGVFLGGTMIDGSQSVALAVEKAITHPSYDPTTNANDIMILKLVKSMPNIKKVKLNLNDPTLPKPNEGIEILGYGKTSESGIKTYSDTLQKVRVITAPEDRCIKYRWFSQKTMVCSWFPSGGRDSCSGDAGGPVMLKGRPLQVAIVSYGNGCGDANFPSVNTRISAQADFIKTTVCAESTTPLAGITCVNPLTKFFHN